jgi:bacterial/archaeal transporter family-2 protein
MSVAAALIPGIIGALFVLQTGLNRRIAGHIGYPGATFLNALMSFLFSGAIMLLIMCFRRSPLVSAEFLISKTPGISGISNWFLVPGLLSVLIVFGGQWSVARWGAIHTFTLFISAQLITSIVWDSIIEQQVISIWRLVGMAITLVGAVIATHSKFMS